MTCSDTLETVTLIPQEDEDDRDEVSSDAPPVKKRIVDWSTAIMKRNRDSELLRGNSRFAELLGNVSSTRLFEVVSIHTYISLKTHNATQKGSEPPVVADGTEDMSAVALLNWEDQIVWGIE